MTPKSLLRHKRVVSNLADMAAGTSFHRVLWDDAQHAGEHKITLRPDSEIRRVVLSSGKIYYDLYEGREAAGIDDVYLMRVEQLYPFPARALMQELGRFPAAEVAWAQEEPKNMGAWSFIEPNLEWVLDRVGGKAKRASYVGRAASAATATGLASKHAQEQKAIVEQALAN
jgi:2-oxoglutarate dehydrogenase E1 component